jgi:hypothetical protein
MTALLLNGTPYGVQLDIKIKQGAEWRETYLIEGDLTDGVIRGYVANKKTTTGESERYADFVIENISFGDFDVDTDDPLLGFTQFDLVLDFEQTELIPITPIKQSANPKAGRDYWEYDVEFVENIGFIPIYLFAGRVFVEGQC